MTKITSEQLKEISNLAESVPEQFRVKCFELLLAHHLSSHETQTGEKSKKEETHKKTSDHKSTFIIPIDVKAFLNQYTIDESILSKLFFIENNEIRPIYELSIHKKTKAQISHALIMSLENSLLTGEFKFNVEALRQRCTDKKCLDAPNFMAILKKYKDFFKSFDSTKDVYLSTDGKTELADILEEFK